MADVDTIISDAMEAADAGSTEETPETGTESTETTETTTETVVPDKVEKPAETVDELGKALEAEGFKAPVPGQRENRVPQSRVREIIERREGKLTEKHTAALAEATKPFQVVVEAARRAGSDPATYVGNLLAAERLAHENPDRYIQVLASINPAFKKFLQPSGETQRPAATTAPAAFSEARPQPDRKFENGDIGYSEEGFQKVLDWNARKAKHEAVAEVSAEFEKKYGRAFGTVQEQMDAHEARERNRPIVESNITRARETWGEDFDKYLHEIENFLNQYDGKNGRQFVDFPAAVSMVLTPKLREREKASSEREKVNREKMRADILKELDKRPAAASRSTPSTSTTDTSERSLEQIIRDEVTAAGLI